jgi:hypothetical protein
MSTVFLATSPLHIIISTLIASSMKKTDCNLILCGKEKERIKLFNTLLTQWPQSPFSSVVSLEHAKRPKNFIHTLNAIKPTEVIVGNDLVPEFFAIAHLSTKFNFKLSYMDDGLHSYIEYDKAVKNKYFHFLQNIARRITKGYTKPLPHTLGSSPLTNDAYLFFPLLAKNRIISKNCLQIIISKKSIMILKDFGKHCCKELNLQLPPSQENIALFVLPHHSRMSLAIQRDFEDSMKKSITKNLIPILKNHPSNDDIIADNILNKFTKNSISTIPKSLPIELIICYKQPNFIMGGLSSIFLSTKAMSDNIKFKLIADKETIIPQQISDVLFSADLKQSVK